MPITTQCPKCQKLYKLKDDLLGKRVTCASQSCRSLFEVLPYVPPGSKQHPKLDAETIAAAAFKDEPDAIEATPEDQRKISMSCNVCEHKFDVAWALQGKNTICPECKTRQKVPEQKVGNQKVDWKNPNAKRPSMAKGEDVPDDVWGGNKANVSVDSLKKGGAIQGPEYEPRPLSFWIKIGSCVAVCLALVIGGIVYLGKSRKEQNQLKMVEEATADFASFKDAGIPPTAAGQFKGLMSLAKAEYHAKQNTTADLKAALQEIQSVRQSATAGDAKGGDRESLIAEAMMIVIQLGGNSEEIKGGGRMPWEPNSGPRKSGPLNNRDQCVVTELQTLFQEMSFADSDFKSATIRRVVRELEAKGQGQIVSAVATSDNADTSAMALLEQVRVTNDPSKVQFEEPDGSMPDAISPTLYALAIATNKQGSLKPPAEPTGSPSQASRMTHLLVKLAKNQTTEALTIAKMPGNPDDRLKAIAMVSELLPAESVAAAVEVLAAAKPNVPHSVYARLAKAAGAAGNDQAVETFLSNIQDDGWKAWAKGDALRAKVTANPSSRADEGTVAYDDPKKLRAGHAWSKLIATRQNAKIGIDVIKESKDLPTGTIRPFAYWGIVLGTLDKAGK